MHIDPVQIILLIFVFYVVLQVIRRTTQTMANFVIFILVLAVLMPNETRGLLSGLTRLFMEIVHRLAYVLGWS